MTIAEIAKNTLLSLKSQSLLPTPENYGYVFCQEAKKGGLSHDECDKLKKFIAKLTPELQKASQQYNPKTLDELLLFLIAKVNREDVSYKSALTQEYGLFVKKILRIISLLRYKKATHIAKNQIAKWDLHNDTKSINFFRDEWERFETNLDLTLLNRLDSLGKVRKDDILEMVEDILTLSHKQRQSFALDGLARIILEALSPSISQEFNKELDIVRARLIDNPSLLADDDFLFELRLLLGKRVSVDRQNVHQHIRLVDDIVDKITANIQTALTTQQSHVEHLDTLRTQMKTFPHHLSFETLKDKLENILEQMEQSSHLYTQDLRHDAYEVESLKNRVSELEKELSNAIQKSQEDFLTKTLNRQGLENALMQCEEKFSHNIPYAIVMFDLDHFKSINDTYGHDAGDVILKSFAQILRKGCRSGDVVVRMGGEEFLVLVKETTQEGALIFAQKIAEIVKKTAFLYKDIRISLTFSAGVCERSHYNDTQTMFKRADELLYDAKNQGRNRIVCDK